MSSWTYEALAASCGGRWLMRPATGASGAGRGESRIAGVCTDSRRLERGEVFVALRGEFFDGHAFLFEAAQAGAAAAIIDSPDALIAPARSAAERSGMAVLVVGDTLEALGDLAIAHRARLEGTTVIGVTGSAGKTTVVRLLDSVLGVAWRGSASAKSFNNAIGVPLTVLGAEIGDAYLVCEVGMNAPGEIASLARIVEPDVCVFTSIGRAHLEAFSPEGDVESGVRGIAREKASLLEYLRPHGLAIAPASGESGGERLDDYLATAPRVVRVGERAGSDVRIERCERSGLGWSVGLSGGLSFGLDRPGRHEVLNAALAASVGRALGLGDASIARGLESATSPEMRFAVERSGGVMVVNDAYNASPESMSAALETFAALSAGAARRVLVLGDMLELGAAAESLHREVGRCVARACPPALLVVVGEWSPAIVDEVVAAHPGTESVIYSSLRPELAARIASRFEPGDAVLVKGSRRLELECVVEAWREASRSESAAE